MRAMQRVVAILESVAESEVPTTAARVTEMTSLSPATVSRIMRELDVEELLDRSADGTYVIGTRLFNLVATAAHRGNRSEAVNRVLQRLRDRTGETTSLHVRRGDQRVCVASAESRQSLRRVLAVGDSVGLVGTVAGDVLMARAPQQERDALVSAAFTGESRIHHLERMEFAATHDYSAYAIEEFGLYGIAVPVLRGERVSAALAVSGPMTRLTQDVAMGWLPALRDAATSLSAWVEPD